MLLASVHCTLEQGTKLVPVTVSVKAAVPAVAFTGETDAIVATGGLDADIVNGVAFELTPKFDTPMLTVFTDAM